MIVVDRKAVAGPGTGGFFETSTAPKIDGVIASQLDWANML
jgi:hypothetical protein